MMNEEIFLKECHDFIDEKYREMLECKRLLEKILDIFHDICVKNNIKYFLGGGTLLGIVRDGMPVPWDPDIDVAVPIDEMPKLLEVLKKELPEKYYVQSNFTERGTENYQTRISHEDYPIDFVHLDIFYVAGAPSDPEELKRMKAEVVSLYKMKRFKSALVLKKYADDTRLRRFAKKWYYRLSCKFKSEAAIDRMFEKLMHKYDYNTSENLIIMEECGFSFPRDVAEPIDTCEKYGYPYLKPGDEIKFETYNYKNFREILPIRCRFDEFYTWICRYNQAVGNGKEISYRNE